MFATLSNSTLIYTVTLSVLGLIVGSFLNVVILRLPASLKYQWSKQCEDISSENARAGDDQAKNDAPPPTLVKPRSFCPQCNTDLKCWHNIPLFSFILLRGKCGFCECNISYRYPFVEILTAGLSVTAGFLFPDIMVLPWVLLAIWMLIALSFIDLDTYLLPDNITLPLMWLGLLFNTSSYGFVSASDALIGAALGYLSLWTVYQIHHFLTKREGMGYGDFKLLAAAGAWLGWKMLPLTLLVAALSGLLVAITLIILKRRGKSDAISFGPFIALAFVIMLFWGPALIRQYYHFIGVVG